LKESYKKREFASKKMKIEYPKVVGIEISPQNRQKLESILRNIPSCEFNPRRNFMSLPEYLSKEGKYGIVFVQDLESLRPALDKSANVILLKERAISERDYAEIANNHWSVGIFSMRQTPEGLAEEITEYISQLWAKKLLKIDFNIGVYGAGPVGRKIVERLSELGRNTLWFSNSLGRKHSENGDNLSYEDVLKQMKNPSVVEPCSDLLDFFAAEPAVMFFATAEHRKLDIPDIYNRSNPDLLRSLIADAFPKLDNFLKMYIEHECRSVIGMISNPPEANGYLAIRAGIDPRKLFTVAPDYLRADKIPELKGKTKLIIGPHHDPLIAGIGKDEFHMSYLGDVPEDEQREQSVAYLSLSRELRERGKEAARLYHKYGIEYTEAPLTAVEIIEDISYNRDPQIGYYVENLGGFTLGPRGKVNKGFSIFPPTSNLLYQYFIRREHLKENVRQRLKPLHNAVDSYLEFVTEDLGEQSTYAR
jgi:hypothetical protein